MIPLDHMGLLETIARSVRPEFYVEFGSAGWECIGRIEPYCGRAVGVDSSRDAAGLGEFYRMSTKQFCTDILPTLPPVDMAFIDADHTSKTAFEDFEALFAHASPGALISLHDTYPADAAQTDSGYCGDSWKVPAMIRAKHPEIEILTIPVPPGLTLVRKSSPGQVQWMLG